MKAKKMIIILLLLVGISFLPTIVKEVKSVGYPVLVWDVPPPTFVGTEFNITFTCFSDSNQTIYVEIWIDGLDLEWSATQDYFVNELVIISTEDQLSGTGHTLEIIATDYALREVRLSTQLIIDSVSPIFNYCDINPINEFGFIKIDRQTPLFINWSVTEENFKDFRIYQDHNLQMVSTEMEGDFSFSFFYLESEEFDIKCVATDDAENTVERTFQIFYEVDEGEWVPQEEVDDILEQNKKDRINALIGASIAIFIALIVIIPLAFKGANDKKEKKL